MCHVTIGSNLLDIQSQFDRNLSIANGVLIGMRRLYYSAVFRNCHVSNHVKFGFCMATCSWQVLMLLWWPRLTLKQEIAWKLGGASAVAYKHRH